MSHSIEIIRLVTDDSDMTTPLKVVRVIAIVKKNMINDDFITCRYVFDVSKIPSSTSFVSFENLTKELVMSWVMSDELADERQEAFNYIDTLEDEANAAKLIKDLSPPWESDNTITPETFGEAPVEMIKRQALEEFPDLQSNDILIQPID